MAQTMDFELYNLKYVEKNKLPTDQKAAKRTIAESQQFTVLDGVITLR